MDLLTLGRQPVRPEQPAGLDVQYEDRFLDLRDEVGRLASPSGADDGPDWHRVVDLASQILATESKDLRAAAFLAVGLVQVQRSEGLVIALRVLADLLENYWKELYPPRKRLRGRRVALDWWVEQSGALLKDLPPDPLTAEQIQSLDDDLGRIEAFLRANLDDAPSLDRFRTFLEDVRVRGQTPAPSGDESCASAPAAPDAEPSTEGTACPSDSNQPSRPGTEPIPTAETALDDPTTIVVFGPPETRPSPAPPPASPEPAPPEARQAVPKSAPGLFRLVRGLFRREKKPSKATPPLATQIPQGAPTPPATESLAPLQFTVYHPQELHPRVWQTLLAYVHIPAMRHTIEADSRKERMAAGAVGERRSEATRVIRREAAITIVPELPGCRFNPPRQTLVWLEDWHRAEFRVQAEPQQPGFALDRAVNGRVGFYVDTVLVGEVRIWALISAAQAIRPGAPPMQTVSADPYQAIFVSYAHEDLEIVARLGSAYEALGMAFLRDQQTLRSGQEWNPRLLSLIERADIFQLYWSAAARSSPHVAQEWRHALAQNREHFIRPIYWTQPMPPTPPELASLHFAYYAME